MYHILERALEHLEAGGDPFGLLIADAYKYQGSHAEIVDDLTAIGELFEDPATARQRCQEWAGVRNLGRLRTPEEMAVLPSQFIRTLPPFRHARR